MTGQDLRAVPATEIDLNEWIRAGDTVAWTQGAGEPVSIVERLIEQRHEIGPFRVLLGTSYSGLISDEHTDFVSFTGFGVVGTSARMAASGDIDIVPVNLSEAARLLEEDCTHVDVLILQVSPPASDGTCTLGAVNGYLHEALRHARVVIFEINTNAPRSTSRTLVRIDEANLIVQSDRPLVEVHERAPTDADRSIASRIAELVPDGATLQLGIGGVPSAVAAGLAGHRHLGLHSGVIGDSTLRLIQSGVIDNSRKQLDSGVSVTGLLAGTSELYRFADRNPALRIEPVRYTHDPAVLRAMPTLIAVNSALEVDLTGQIGSEVLGGRFVGIIGGQADFARGAMASPGGKSVIGLASRSGRSQQSRIVPLLRSGVVSTHERMPMWW